eukprot:1811881-Rhodomonas_salina.2
MSVRVSGPGRPSRCRGATQCQAPSALPAPASAARSPAPTPHPPLFISARCPQHTARRARFGSNEAQSTRTRVNLTQTGEGALGGDSERVHTHARVS